MDTALDVQSIIQKVVRCLVEGYQPQQVILFGSLVGGNPDEDSDIDFLIDAGPTTSSWFPAGLILDLEEILGRRVEIVTDKALNPYIRDHVLREAIPL